MCGSEKANTRNALSLHRVCAMLRQPTLDTLSASTGYVRCRDPPNLDTLSASTGYVWCRDSLTLDTLSVSTGYVRCRDSQHSTHSRPPQGMCDVETANTRHALSLHRVCVVPRQPTLDTLSASTGYVWFLDRPTLDTLSSSTGYVWFRDSQHSIRAQPPQGMCCAETANARYALSLLRVCVVPRQPTLDTLSASTGYVWFLDRPTLDTLSASIGYVWCLHSPTLDTLSASTGSVWFRDSQHSIRAQPPQGM